MIFVAIAATSTPLCLVLYPPNAVGWRFRLMAIAARRPKAFGGRRAHQVGNVLYIGNGWAGALLIPALWRNGYAAATLLLVAGGVIYPSARRLRPPLAGAQAERLRLPRGVARRDDHSCRRPPRPRCGWSPPDRRGARCGLSLGCTGTVGALGSSETMDSSQFVRRLRSVSGNDQRGRLSLRPARGVTKGNLRPLRSAIGASVAPSFARLESAAERGEDVQFDGAVGKVEGEVGEPQATQRPR